MKEYVLQLLEELVGAHTLRAKQEKAAEIAALVATAVFPADQAEEPEAQPISFGDVGAVGTIGIVVPIDNTTVITTNT